MAKWIVHTKGSAGNECFEIAVLREDNLHGQASYGWFDENKLLISHNGGPCHWPVTRHVWEKLIAVAHEVAADLNATSANTKNAVLTEVLKFTPRF